MYNESYNNAEFNYEDLEAQWEKHSADSPANLKDKLDEAHKEWEDLKWYLSKHLWGFNFIEWKLSALKSIVFDKIIIHVVLNMYILYI